MKPYYLEVQCIVCGKELMRGDYIYGACHKCTKIAIDRMVKTNQHPWMYSRER